MSIMLGKISTRDLHGPWLDFMNKLQTKESELWFEGFKKFLRKENPWQVRNWREENGVIYFSLTSDGTTGEEWITRLERNGLRVRDCVKQVLRSPNFKSTNGVTTKVAILKSTLFKDDNRVTKKIRAKADKHKLSKPNAELACLICEKFTHEEIEAMGLLYIVAMHEPINDSDNPILLGVNHDDDGCWLAVYYDDKPDGRWYRNCGFAFAVSS